MITKAGNTGRRGGQYGNKNAAKDFQGDVETGMWKEAYQYWEPLEKAQKAHITRAQQDAIRRYAGFTYQWINGYLRKDKEFLTRNSEMARLAREIIAAASPLPHNTFVYRGSPHSMVKDSEFLSKGFVSTSLRPNMAQAHTPTGALGNEKKMTAVNRIYVPKGTPVVYGNGGELEIILMPGSRFKVLGRKTKDGWNELEYVPNKK